MKIPKAHELSQVGAVDADATKQALARKAKTLASQSAQLLVGSEGRESDRVSLGLARVLRNELSVESITEERAAKVARIKELVQSGRYQVDSEKVARSLVREISFEIDAEKLG